MKSNDPIRFVGSFVGAFQCVLHDGYKTFSRDAEGLRNILCTIFIDRSVNNPLEGKRNVVARIRADDDIQSGGVTRVACLACMARLLEIN